MNIKFSILLCTFYTFCGCNGQEEKKSNPQLEDEKSSIIDTLSCFDSNNKYLLSIKENGRQRQICLSFSDQKSICNENLLFDAGALGAISNDNNIFINCKNGAFEIDQEYGGTSPQGSYFFTIIHTSNGFVMDSISISEKLFLEKEVILFNKGKDVMIPFNEKSDLSKEYQKLSEELYVSKNQFIINYLEKLPIENGFNESENLLENVQINSNNVNQVNNLAYRLENANQFEEAIILLEKITNDFPDRVVAYLNLADAYWDVDEKPKAKENYKTYVALMKSQGKDLSKIPQRVYERSK